MLGYAAIIEEKDITLSISAHIFAKISLRFVTMHVSENYVSFICRKSQFELMRLNAL